MMVALLLLLTVSVPPPTLRQCWGGVVAEPCWGEEAWGGGDSFVVVEDE